MTGPDKQARDVRAGDYVLVNARWRRVSGTRDLGAVRWCGGSVAPAVEIRLRGAAPRRFEVMADSVICIRPPESP